MKRSARIVFLSMMSAGFAGGLLTTAGMAQTIQLNAVNTAGFKVLYAKPKDIAEGKRVAETACMSCHGINGIAKQKEVPHIAGQRPVYLYHEIKQYQAGARGSNTMANTVKYMNDDAILKVSAYYASLEPAEPTISSSAKLKRAKPNAIEAGKSAAAGCSGCHGETGISETPGMPSLVAMVPEYFKTATNAYKSGQRKHDMMKTLVSDLSETDLNHIALFYAQQKPGKAKTPAPGNIEAGKTAAAGCVGCHGEGGVSTNPTTPSLAGQDAQYFLDAMRAYKDGSRNDATMKGPATSIDETTVKNLAAYYASLTPEAPKVSKPLTFGEWATRCDACHGINGNSTDPRLPALAAQRVEYLARVLHAYKKGERKSREMAVMSEVLDDALVDELAAYYAQQKARGLVYLVLPPPPTPK